MYEAVVVYYGPLSTFILIYLYSVYEQLPLFFHLYYVLLCIIIIFFWGGEGNAAV